MKVQEKPAKDIATPSFFAADTIAQNYVKNFQSILDSIDWTAVEDLAESLWECWQADRQVFLCGNGGSAANAVHLANDFIYGIAPEDRAIRVTALPSNSSILTCLGNDTGYENIYAHQLRTLGKKNDWLIAFSGSGNSPNIVKAIETANQMGIHTAAVLGFSGGKCKQLVDVPIHVALDDMQISEDIQMVVGHIITRILQKMKETRHGFTPMDGNRQ